LVEKTAENPGSQVHLSWLTQGQNSGLPFWEHPCCNTRISWQMKRCSPPGWSHRHRLQFNSQVTGAESCKAEVWCQWHDTSYVYLWNRWLVNKAVIRMSQQGGAKSQGGAHF